MQDNAQLPDGVPVADAVEQHRPSSEPVPDEEACASPTQHTWRRCDFVRCAGSSTGMTTGRNHWCSETVERTTKNFGLGSTSWPKASRIRTRPRRSPTSPMRAAAFIDIAEGRLRNWPLSPLRGSQDQSAPQPPGGANPSPHGFPVRLRRLARRGGASVRDTAVPALPSNPRARRQAH